ncbi:signal peptidase I [Ardenticatena maritima]|uniref:signal peptidase I n=2 Tax=Ardenticatena maritima TaxID=872965 RepID=UPI000761E851|nr:signal peptidase I [Ardenticatena maritima]
MSNRAEYNEPNTPLFDDENETPESDLWNYWQLEPSTEHTESSPPAALESTPMLDTPPQPLSSPHPLWGFLRELLETVILTLLIFALVRIPTQTFRIEGSSMLPNFHNGQFLIVNKAVYWFREPQRGEVIVFRFSDNPRKDYIKRVIGLPGETVEVRQGQVYINGQPLEEPWKPNPGSYTKTPITLGPDEYYVLGDNRNNSSDSHLWGPIHRNRIIGKAWFIYWPPPFAISDIPIVGPILSNLLNRWGIHALFYTPSPHWGIVPTFADPLGTPSNAQQEPVNAIEAAPATNSAPAPEAYPSPVQSLPASPPPPPADAYPSPYPGP